jgi:class 3 adenylate cyclase/tetratricopeptide (TPR) repeat protein
VQVCPNCGEENPPRFRLCGFCGAPLARAAPVREVRKTVTIVFCDLKGSTNLGERLDSESLREVLNRYFDAMRVALERHGGTIEKFIGDAVMAVFGLPRLHEDDALRAVRAAVDMQTALQRLNASELEPLYGVALTNRIGINTGEVVAGDPTAGQRLVTGDAVNVAARLEQAAPANEILLGELTYRLVRDAVDADPVEPLELKGKSERVAAYRLRSVRRASHAQPVVDAPIVGRRDELAALEGTLADAVARRRARLALLLADAGMGKSRLVQEFAHRADAAVLRGRCLPYGEGITFWPLAELARAAAGIVDGDSPGQARARLAALLGAGGVDVAERLAAAIGLSEEAYPIEETFWAARKLLESLAARRPLVAVFEDVHWAQETLLDLIEHVVDGVEAAPMLVVCTARPEFLESPPSLASRDDAAAIRLAPLSADESAQVIAHLLDDTGLDAAVVQTIVGAADGNPLFVEQLLSMLVDEGVLRREDGGWAAPRGVGSLLVPPTLHALLAARLDRLGPEERAIIEPASVAGHVFQQEAVEALVAEPLRAGVQAHLASLTRKELVQPAGHTVTGASFRFRHMLVRDAAYGALLKRARAELHEQFARWLERVAGERLSEYEEILGYHLEQAHEYRAALGPLDAAASAVAADAAQHLTSSGRRAFHRGDVPAAANLLRRAIRLLPPADPARAAVVPDLAEALMDVGEFDEARALLGEALAVARAGGDARLEAEVSVVDMLVRYASDADGAAGAVLAEAPRAAATLAALGDDRGTARAWRVLVVAHGTAGRYTDAEHAATRAIEHAQRAGDRREEMRNLAGYAMFALYGRMPVADALQRCETILRQTAGDRRSEGLVSAVLAHLHALSGDIAAARAMYRRARQVLTDLGGKVLAASVSVDSCEVELLAGDPRAAERELRGDYDLLAEMGERYLRSTVAGLLAGVLIDQGRLDEAARFCHEGEALAAADDVDAQSLWRRARARLLARAGHPDDAERLVREALELARQADSPAAHASVLVDLAEVLDVSGRTSDAAGALADARALLLAKGSRFAADQVDARRGPAGASALHPDAAVLGGDQDELPVAVSDDRAADDTHRPG